MADTTNHQGVAPRAPVSPEDAMRAPDRRTPRRRGFLTSVIVTCFGSPLAVGFTSLIATHMLWLLGTARFMFPNVLIEPASRFKVGYPEDFSPGQVETKYKPQHGVWIVRHEYGGQAQIYALRAVCTHLGCTPYWQESEEKFKCPCHGSGFYKNGVNFEGPAPRPLERYAIRLADDGQLEVDKSRVYREELGQWSDLNSYVLV
jgi:cytochrome b6-f complex iron-sulfur subunit